MCTGMLAAPVPCAKVELNRGEYLRERPGKLPSSPRLRRGSYGVRSSECRLGADNRLARVVPRAQQELPPILSTLRTGTGTYLTIDLSHI